MARSRITNPAMQVNNISPHSIGKSAVPAAAHRVNSALVAPGGHDPKGLEKHGQGVLAKHQDVRTAARYNERDTALSHGGADGCKGLQADIKGKTVKGAGAHAASSHSMNEGSLYGTQSDDREGFGGPNDRILRKQESAATSTPKSPKSK